MISEARSGTSWVSKSFTARSTTSLGLMVDAISIVMSTMNSVGSLEFDRTRGKIGKDNVVISFIGIEFRRQGKSKFQSKMLDLKDGKLYGDQGEAMNRSIREMLYDHSKLVFINQFHRSFSPPLSFSLDCLLYIPPNSI